MSEEKSIEKSFVVSHLIKQNKQLEQRNKDLEAYKFEAEKLADAVIRNNQLRMDGTHEQQLVKLNVMSLMLTLANKLKGKSDE